MISDFKESMNSIPFAEPVPELTYKDDIANVGAFLDEMYTVLEWSSWVPKIKEKMIEVIVFDLGGVIVNVNFKSPLGMLFDNSGTVSNKTKDKSNFSNLLRFYDMGKISVADFHEKINDHLDIELSFDEFISASNEAIESGDDVIEKILRSLSKEIK